MELLKVELNIYLFLSKTNKNTLKLFSMKNYLVTNVWSDECSVGSHLQQAFCIIIVKIVFLIEQTFHPLLFYLFIYFT